MKHFKFEPRGKRRLHKRPNAYEIERCRWWNEIERGLIKPKLVVALGVTAARSLMARVVTISEMRGKLVPFEGQSQLLVTIHPSSLLRIPDADEKAKAYRGFVADLRLCGTSLAKPGLRPKKQ